MTSKHEIYKCEVCGNIVEVLHSGKGELVCCNQPMILQKENSEGEYAEKHAPVIKGNKVKVGNIWHPMKTEHYIEWIEATAEDRTKAKIFLDPEKTEYPEAEFCFKPISARMYCNIHGLWKNE